MSPQPAVNLSRLLKRGARYEEDHFIYGFFGLSCAARFGHLAQPAQRCRGSATIERGRGKLMKRKMSRSTFLFAVERQPWLPQAPVQRGSAHVASKRTVGSGRRP